MSTEMADKQKAICLKYHAEYTPPNEEDKTGFALSTLGILPINGLRHSPQNGTSGWYIWCGESYSESADFFVSLHTQHIYDEYPQIGTLLALPPGFRFLLAGEHLDI